MNIKVPDVYASNRNVSFLGEVKPLKQLDNGRLTAP
jgi:hypothetical protein